MPPRSARHSADWFIHDGALTLTNRCQIPNSNNLVTANLSVACAESTFSPNSIFGTNTDISLTTYSTFNHRGIPGRPSSLNGSNGNHPFLIKADKNSIVGGGNAGCQNIDLANSPGDAIVVQGNSQGYIGNVTGAGNHGYGISCTQMSTARVNLPVGPTSVAGITGQTLIGTVPRSYAALPYTDVGELCRIGF